jgi:Xaa-Pro dipeptidase
VEQGGVNIHNLVIGFGEGSAISHNIPSARKLREGDCFRFDLGATYHCYYGDTARTKILGEPTKAQANIYEAVLDAQQKAALCIKQGVTAGEIYETAMHAARQILPDFIMEHVGHGLGIEMHENPALIWKNSEKLETGMVLNVETIYRDKERGGFAVEDTFLVTKGGFECWTSLNRSLTL